MRPHVPIISKLGVTAASSEESLGGKRGFSTTSRRWLSDEAQNLLYVAGDCQRYLRSNPNYKGELPRIPSTWRVDDSKPPPGLPRNAIHEDYLAELNEEELEALEMVPEPYDFSIDEGVLR